MEYLAEVGRIVSAHIDELEADLDRAKHALQRARRDSLQLERQVVHLESLLELASSRPTAFETQGMTLHEAMAHVLSDAPLGMLRAADLAAEINRRHLYRMRDGRPVEPQQIHARVGQYPHRFVREGTFIKLAVLSRKELV